MRPDRFIVFLIGFGVGSQAFAAAVYFNPPAEPPGKTVLIRTYVADGHLGPAGEKK